MPTPWLGHLQWGLASLSQHPWDQQGTAHQKPLGQWHKHSWDPPLTNKAKYIGKCRNPQSIYNLPHYPPNTLPTLYTSGIIPQWSPHHIKSTLNCLHGLLHIYYISLLSRKAPLVRRHIPLYWLASIRQRIQIALHMTLVSCIQAPKWALANTKCALSAQADPVSYLPKVSS